MSYTQSQFRVSPMFVHVYKYVNQKVSAAMLAIKKPAGVTPEMNLRNPLRAGDGASKQRKGSILTLKPRADRPRVSQKQGYQWPHKKYFCIPKN